MYRGAAVNLIGISMVHIRIVMVIGVTHRIIVPGTPHTSNPIAMHNILFFLGLVWVSIDVDPVFRIRLDVSQVRGKMRNRVNSN